MNLPPTGPVSELFGAIRDHSRRSQQMQRSQSDASAITASQLRLAAGSALSTNPDTASFFEVQYVCKIKTSHRKGPPSFIDDALEHFYQFKKHNLEKQAVRGTPDDPVYLMGDRSGSTDSVNSVGSGSSAGAGQVQPLAEVPGPVPRPSQLTPVAETEPCEQRQLQGLPPAGSTGQAQPAFRTRAMSGGADRLTRRGVQQQEESMRMRAGSVGSCPSRRRLSSTDHNYTMLFQIGKQELFLISPENKAVKLHKTYRDISQVTQGQKNGDHFGFICRESAPAGQSDPAAAGSSSNSTTATAAAVTKNSHVGYIFRCQNAKIAEDIINTLSQACRSAHEQSRQGRKLGQLVPCDYCPANWFNKLCAELEGLSAEAAQSVILRSLDCLPAEERRELLLKYSGAETVDTDEQNELLMSLLRFLCDEKQRRHTHVSPGQPPTHGLDGTNLLFDLSSGLNKAKRSLTSRLENVWRHGRVGREEQSAGAEADTAAGGQTQTVFAGAGAGESGPRPTSHQSNTSTPAASPTSSRPRSSTIAGSSVEGYKREYMSSRNASKAGSGANSRLESPMVTIFKRMGNSPRTPDLSWSPGVSPLHTGTSWRQAIFHRIRTPGETSPLVERSRPSLQAGPSRRSGSELRLLWKKAIYQQILINRTERENARITERVQSGDRVMYAEMPPCPADLVADWRRLIDSWRTGGTVHADQLETLVLRGVSTRLRAEVWQLLAWHRRQHYKSVSVEHVQHYNTPYRQLITQLTEFQREILTDLGRTFPQHPYFRSPFGAGQLELFNVLKAVSLLDPELGYCQGLGFIAGILLLHMPEEEAYDLLKHMLFSLELRKQFLPDMSPLHVQMYQFSRLVHDHHKDLYEHLERYEVSPTLYATPWFLTLFSSQYPIGFSARVFDLILLSGLEAVFKVSLALLEVYKPQLLSKHGMEDIMEFIKTDMPRLGHSSVRTVFNKAVQLDISRQLLSYDVEYHVLQEEVLASPSRSDEDINRLATTNQALKRQTIDLLGQLQTATDQLKTVTGRVKSLESRVASLESQRGELVTFVRYLSLHTPDRLEIPQRFRQYLTVEADAPDEDGVDPLHCAVFEQDAPRPPRARLALRTGSVDLS